MLGLLLIYFIGKQFYVLAESFKQNKWLFAILSVVVYYAAGLIFGVVLGLFDVLFEWNINWDDNIGINLLGIPVLDDKGKQIGRARVVAVEPFTRKQDKVVGGKYIETGPPKTYSAGQVLAEVPYEQKPVKNLYPVEIFRSDSPKGVKSSEYGIHYGSKITEVLERTKDKIASRGVGGGGGLFPTERGLPGGKRPLKMAQGGLVDKALERNTKFI